LASNIADSALRISAGTPSASRGEQADPDAGADVDLGLVDDERLRERLIDPLRDRLGPQHRAVGPGLVAVEVGEEQQELVAAATRHEVGLAGRLAETLRHRDQQAVAGDVAERVVHQAEVDQVDAEHGDRALVSPRPRDRQVHQLLEHLDDGSPVSSSWYVRNATWSSAVLRPVMSSITPCE
jgi:hypothetical protein